MYSIQASIPFCTYSTYSLELGGSGGSAGWGSYCSASPNYASLGKAASRACPARVQHARCQSGRASPEAMPARTGRPLRKSS